MYPACAVVIVKITVTILLSNFNSFGGRQIACMDISGFIPLKALCTLP